MNMLVRFWCTPIFILIAIAAGCQHGGGGSQPLSSDKAITSFSFTGYAATGRINEGSKAIAITVPAGTDVRALVATFATTGMNVKVGTTVQVSGTTKNDFTSLVVYTVTAPDGSTASYMVTVAVSATSTIALPKTGQATCYDDAGNVTSCADTEQDGNLQQGAAWPIPRFTDNHDGTINDNLTGLMWLQDANCIKTQSPSFDADGTAGDGAVTWQHALDFVHDINTGTQANCGAGYADWRLPNRKELRSLIHYGENDLIAWLNEQGFANVRPAFYWTSTTYAADTQSAWYVCMYDGSVYAYNKLYSFYLWPVRTGK